MDLSRIQTGMVVEIISIPESGLKTRLRQFGFVEGVRIKCRYVRNQCVALEWLGTAVAMRRKDLRGIVTRVIA